MASSYTDADLKRYQEILSAERDFLNIMEQHVVKMSALQTAEKMYQRGLDKRRDIVDNIRSKTSEIDSIEKSVIKSGKELTTVQKERLTFLRDSIGLDAAILENSKEELQLLTDKLKLEEKMSELEKRQSERMEIVKEMTKTISSLAGEAGGKFMEIGEHMAKAVKSGDLMQIALMAMSEILKLAVDRYTALQKSGEKFRLESGLTLDQSRELTKQVEELNKNYQDMGISLDVAYGAAKSMMDVVGNANAVKNMGEMTKATAMLQSNFGVASDDAAGFLFQMQKVGHLSSTASVDMAGYAARMSKAAGVPLPKVMKDVAEASAETLTMVGGSVDKLVKAAVQARSLGVSLNDAGKSARQFLNFGESINAEMEASVLSGKNINFQLARQKAWNKDVAGAQTEVLHQLERAGDFTQMNAFQQESLAKASGYTVEQLTKMVENKTRIANLSWEQVHAEDALALQQKQMQSNITNINNSFQKMFNLLGDIFGGPISGIAKLLGGIADAAGWLKNQFDSLSDGAKSAWGWVSVIIAISVVAGVLFLAFKTFGSWLERFAGSLIKTTFTAIGDGLKSLGEGLSSLGTGKALMGALAILMLGGAFALMGWGLSKLNPEQMARIPAMLIAFSVALAVLALVVDATEGLVILAILAIGAAFLGLGFGIKLAGEGISIAVTSISNAFKILSEIGGDLINTIKNAIVGVITPFISLAMISPLLFVAALGISAIAVSLAAFGGGSMLAGIGSGIGSLFGGDVFSNLTKLSGLGRGLQDVATALSSIAESLLIISNTKVDTKPITDMMNSGASSNMASGFSNVVSAVVGGNKENKSSDTSQQQLVGILTQLVDAINGGIEIKNFEVLKLSRKLAMATNKQGATIAPI